MKLNTLIFVVLSLLSIKSLAGDPLDYGCKGKVTSILTGHQYCEAGERIGFGWGGSSKWLCSTTKNMDAMLMAAFATGSVITVKQDWETCEKISNGETPKLIWFNTNN